MQELPVPIAGHIIALLGEAAIPLLCTCRMYHSLSSYLRLSAQTYSREPRHDEIAYWLFSPWLWDTKSKLYETTMSATHSSITLRPSVQNNVHHVSVSYCNDTLWLTVEYCRWPSLYWKWTNGPKTLERYLRKQGFLDPEERLLQNVPDRRLLDLNKRLSTKSRRYKVQSVDHLLGLLDRCGPFWLDIVDAMRLIQLRQEYYGTNVQDTVKSLLYRRLYYYTPEQVHCWGMMLYSQLIEQYPKFDTLLWEDAYVLTSSKKYKYRPLETMFRWIVASYR